MVSTDLDPAHRVARLDVKPNRIKIDLGAVFRHDGAYFKGVGCRCGRGQHCQEQSAQSAQTEGSSALENAVCTHEGIRFRRRSHALRLCGFNESLKASERAASQSKPLGAARVIRITVR